MMEPAEQHRFYFEMATDYPRLTDSADIAGDEDRAIATTHLRDMEARHSEDHEYCTFAYRALNLLSPRDFALALPRVNAGDPRVQALPCETIGLLAQRRGDA